MYINLFVELNLGLSAVYNGGQNGIHCHHRHSIKYEYTKHIVKINDVLRH
jgi:hypothetical protein